MFTLVTGAPGSGKTSHVLAKYKDEVDRPIFHRGIKGLALPWVELTDDEAREWHRHVSDGAIVIIDEVQDIFPQRPLSRPTPEGCSILSKHRHRGLDVVFITQAPTAVDHEARKYVNEHFHYSRSFGAPVTTEYHKGNGVIDLKDKWALKTECNKRQCRLPKKVFGLYHSAEVHTHKFRIPTKLFVIPVLLAFVVASAIYMYGWVTKDRSDMVEAVAGEVIQDQAGSSARTVKVSNGVGLSAEQWKDLLTPAIRGVPYTAPIYAAKASKPETVPIVAGCAKFADEPDSCQCYTQQGTPIGGMPNSVCLKNLEHRQFNFLKKEPKRDQRTRAGAESGFRPARVDF